MGNSFKVLRFFSSIFKVLAFLWVILIGVSVAGLLVARKTQPDFPIGQAVTQVVVSGIVGFLLFFALGEIIRLLLAIEAQTHRDTVGPS